MGIRKNLLTNKKNLTRENIDMDKKREVLREKLDFF